MLYAAVHGYLADIENKDVKEFNKGLIEHVLEKHPDILEEIKTKKDLNKELEEKIDASINEYKKIFKL